MKDSTIEDDHLIDNVLISLAFCNYTINSLLINNAGLQRSEMGSVL